MNKPERNLGMVKCEKFWYDKWEKYHNWYIKTKCIKKEDLNVERIASSIYNKICFDGASIKLPDRVSEKRYCKVLAQSIVDYLFKWRE